MKRLGYSKIRNFTSSVLVFYCAMLLLQCAAPCFAETSALEGKIIGTGPLKVWLNIGSAKGVETDMIFEVLKGGERIAKVLVKKVGTTSSEAVIAQLKQDAVCESGDAVKFLSKAAPEMKKEEVKKDEPKKEESKPEEAKPELKKEEPKKEETKPAETTALAVTTAAIPAPPAETAPKAEDKKPETKKRIKKKFGSGLFKVSSTKFLFIALIGVAAIAIGSGGKKSSGGGDAGSADQTSQTPPPVDF